jgi:hypothetical protein
MKHSLRLCSFLLTAGLVLAGCEEPSSTASSDPSFGGKPGGGGGSSTPADPELTYVGSSTIKGKSYATLYVMDVDGTHLTAVHRCATTTVSLNGSPTWSPDGGSIVFTQRGNGSTIPDSIKVIDISLNSSGQPVGTNLRTIVGLSSVSVGLKNPFWSATSTSDLIAYTTDDGTTNSLYTVSANGGSPSLINSVDKTWAGHSNPLGVPTWNGDDSKLAMIRIGVNSTTIMIFNTSTWDYIDSIVVSGSIFGLEWSRSGSTNSLAYSTNGKISYVEPITGAIPTTNNANGAYPSWAPDNSTLMVVSGTGAYNNTAFSSSSSFIATVPAGCAVKWK